MRRKLRRDRGVALIVTLLAISLFSALTLGLALSSSVDRLATANHEQASVLLNVADAGIELAARELAAIADWNTVLTGAVRSRLVDGPPAGVRTPFPGFSIDLTAATNRLTCGRPSACTDAAVRASTSERPWGANNPFWQLFIYTAIPELTNPRTRTASYLIVWIGDDAAEVDGERLIDGGGAGDEGRYILRARAEALSAGGARRAIEADLTRVCTPTPAGESCLPGTRVQSWRVATGGLP
jgi:hypothetical protein